MVPESQTLTANWVSPSYTRNYFLEDPILDWMKLYGRDHGFISDNELPGYDPRLDFSKFVMNLGIKFEAGVVALLAKKATVVRIADTSKDSRDPAFFQKTLDAMKAGIPIIHQGVLHHAPTQTFGMPDLLVRADTLEELFGIKSDGPTHHYIVVDIKYSTLHLLKKGTISTTQNHFAAQVWLYNRALGLAQGFTPERSYLLGRAWQQLKERGDNCLEKLGAVEQDSPLAEEVSAAIEWVRLVRDPSTPMPAPNMKNTSDSPWHNAKKLLAPVVGEVALTNPAPSGDWQDTAGYLDLYVDFETVSDVNDDFSNLPFKNSEPRIFQIGLGWVEDGTWLSDTFTSKGLSDDAETEIIEAWLTKMTEIQTRLGGTRRVWCYSQAEASNYSTAYNAAKIRHDNDWPEIVWSDLLKIVRVMGERNALGFGLKAVAKSLTRQGFINVAWPDSAVADGLGASMAGWSQDPNLLQQCAAYNEIDTKAMFEVLSYLRKGIPQ